jgi:hypothetical protein
MPYRCTVKAIVQEPEPACQGLAVTSAGIRQPRDNLNDVRQALWDPLPVGFKSRNPRPEPTAKLHMKRSDQLTGIVYARRKQNIS